MRLGLGIGVRDDGGGAALAPPAAPTLTAPAASAVLAIGANQTVSATTTDSDLDRIDFVTDPSGPGTGGTIVATDSTDPYTQTWAVNASAGAHTMVARAVRGALVTDSAAVAFSAVNTTLRETHICADGNWTSPTITTGTAWIACGGAGGGGTTATGGGGGGAVSIVAAFVYTASTAYAFVVPAGGAINTTGADGTFNATTCLAKGGASGTAGGAGGAAASGTGDSKYSGGAGEVDIVNGDGGAGAGLNGGATTTTPGEPIGGRAATAAIGGIFGAGGGSSAVAGFAGQRAFGIARAYFAATAGFPRIEGFRQSRMTAGATSFVVPMPDGTLNTGTMTAGSTIYVVISSDGAPAVTATDYSSVSTVNGSQSNLTVLTKTAAGGDTCTLALSASEEATVYVFSVIGGGTASFTTSVGASSTNADGPSHDHGSSVNGLWGSLISWDHSASLLDVSAFPTGFPHSALIPARTTGGAALGIAIKEETAQVVNPGAYTSTTEQWCAITFCIPPA